MLFDEWNSSQQAARQTPASSSSSRGGPVAPRSSAAAPAFRGVTDGGYESEEEERIPDGGRSGNSGGAYQSNSGTQRMNMPGNSSTFNLSQLNSSIITQPNDPSLAPLDQVGGLPHSANDAPMFQLERLDWKPKKEQGAIVGLAVGSGVLFIATQNCTIVRWNVDTDEFEEIVISKRADDRIHKVFLDPTGHHGIIAMENGQVYYMHSRWSKAHLLSKVKGIIIESIAWNTALGTELSTKKILIGTNRGLIYETCIEEKDKYFKKIHDLIFDDMSANPSSSSKNETQDLQPTTPVSGLYMELFPSSADLGETGYKWFVMAATPNRQFQFIGGPTFEALFGKYTGNIPNSFKDFPGDLNYSELRMYSKYQGRAKSTTADSCAWMNGVGIYYGNLVFGSQDKGQDVLLNGKLLAYPSVPDPVTGQMRNQPPVSLTLTEFHFILLMKNRLIAINQLSEDIVYEEVFNVQTFGEMQGLATDSRKDTVWLYSDKFVFAVDITNEDRDAWKLYLQEGKFELALEYCDTDQQIERVQNAKADYLFEQGNFEQAAKIYAETGRSFEEVALKFVNISQGLPVPSATTLGVNNSSASSSSALSPSSSPASASSSSLTSPISLSRLTLNMQQEARVALKAYLMAKLATLDPTELTQQVMICTWLTEIFLDNINRLQEGTVESAASLLRKRAVGSTATKAAPNQQGLVQTTSPFPDMDSTLDSGLTGVGLGHSDDIGASPETLAALAEERAQAHEDEIHDFKEFLVEYFDCLNKETTFELISSHGRIHELLFYALTIGDYEWVLQYHLQQGNYFAALEILSKHEHPTKILDKYYKFCPTLMYYLPEKTVDMLIKLGKILDPSKLIPALMRYGEEKKSEKETRSKAREEKKGGSDYDDDHDIDEHDFEPHPDSTNHAIRYLQHMILNLQNRDPVIHNYLISLYAKQEDERPLEDFIQKQKKDICFDYKYALRICHEEKKYRSCVSIYEVQRLYEEAVRMALEIDLELAKGIVMRAQQESDLRPAGTPGYLDDHQRKRLWILIAKYVINHEQDISKAMKILKECEVRLEEILPFFPDFVRIGEFKEEICKSLDQYNAKIEHLKSEMEEYTDSANLIRQDINQLRSRYGVVTSNQKCDICSQIVLTRQFVLFPCTHTFHTSCCLAEATRYLNAHPQRKAQVLADEEFKDASIAAASTTVSPTPTSSSNSKTILPYDLSKDARDLKSIENFASSECCLCGEMMIDSVATPFIALPEEEAEAKAWEIF